jgi:hypothetical protein
MTTDALTRALAILNEPRGADGLARSNDPRGIMVSADELANRREIEGGAALIMCGGCGYGLGPADTRCPKCGSGSYEVATALVERDHLPDLLAEHKEAEKNAPKSAAVIAARATGKPCSSQEYQRAYQAAKRKHQKKEN